MPFTRGVVAILVFSALYAGLLRVLAPLLGVPGSLERIAGVLGGIGIGWYVAKWVAHR